MHWKSCDRSAHANGSPDGPEAVVASAVTVLTLSVAFGALALGIPWFWVAFPVGFGGVMPLAVSLARRRAQRATPTDDPSVSADPTPTDEDALETLRERYARGEIDEDELDRGIETLFAEDSDRRDE